MCLCENRLKGKTAHFRLPSASQKRACLSSLILAPSYKLSMIALVNNLRRGIISQLTYFASSKEEKKKELALSSRPLLP